MTGICLPVHEVGEIILKMVENLKSWSEKSKVLSFGPKAINFK